MKPTISNVVLQLARSARALFNSIDKYHPAVIVDSCSNYDDPNQVTISITRFPGRAFFFEGLSVTPFEHVCQIRCTSNEYDSAVIMLAELFLEKFPSIYSTFYNTERSRLLKLIEDIKSLEKLESAKISTCRKRVIKT